MARRTAWREKGRAVMVVLMIGLPVGAVAAASLAVSTEAAAHVRATRVALGAADLHLATTGMSVVGQSVTGEDVQSGDPLAAVPLDPTEQLPPGSRLVRRLESSGSLTYQGLPFHNVARVEVDLTDPMLAGTTRLVTGRLPRAVGEAVVTPRLAERLGVRSGGTLTMTGSERTVTVVGVVESTASVDHRGELLALPGSLGLTAGTDAAAQWYATTPKPLTVAQISALNGAGWVVVSADLLDHPPTWCTDRTAMCTGTTDWSLGGESFAYGGSTSGVDQGAATVVALAVVMALLQVVLLIGPAFAVGLRRRRRDLGLLAVTGARPGQLRRVVLAEALVLGGVGAVGGSLLAWLAVWRFSGLLEQTGSVRWLGLPAVSPLVVVVVVVGVLTALAAALAPARQAARTDAASAVGRGSLHPSGRHDRRTVVIGGIAAVVIGSVTVVWLALTQRGLGASGTEIVLLLALIAAELGVVALAPTVVALVAARTGGLPLTPRLAARDAARNRLRSGAAVAAVTAAVAGSVSSLLYFASMDAADQRGYQPFMRPNLVTASTDGTATTVELAAIQTALSRTLPVLRSWPIAEVQQAGDFGQGGVQPGITVDAPVAQRCPDGTQADKTLPLIGSGAVASTGPSSGSGTEPGANDPRCTDPRLTSTGTVLGRSFQFLVADADALAAMTGTDSPAARSALDAGGAVVFSPHLMSGDRLNFTVWLAAPGTPTTGAADVGGPQSSKYAIATTHHTISVPGAVVTDGPVPAVVVLSPKLVQSSGVALNSQLVLATTSRTPSGAEADAANAAFSRITGEETDQVQFENGPPRHALYYLLLGIVGLAVLIGAAASISAAGLALADSRSDLATLAAVGAPPRVRRRLAAWQAGVLTLLGSALGLAAGFLPGWAMVHLTGDSSLANQGVEAPTPLVVPWLPILAVAVGLPLVTSAVVWLSVRSRVVLVRRTD